MFRNPFPRPPYPPTWPYPYPGTLVWECLSLLPLAMWAGKAVKSAAEQTCLKAHEKGYEHGKG